MIPYLPHKYCQKKVSICSGKWNEVDNKIILQQMKQWSVQILIAWNNERSDILKDIAHIDFTTLRTLSLKSNQIESIEGIAEMIMPQLEELHLNQNRIRLVGSLRKVKWEKITELNIADNYVSDGCSLIECNFPALDQMKVDKYSLPPFLIDLRFFFKMQTEPFQTLTISHLRKNFHPHFQSYLKKKWEHFQVWF